MAEENDVTDNKLAEENQVTKKEPQQVTTKNPKKVEVGKRLAEHNHRRREVKKVKSEGVSQYYEIGVVLAVGVIGGLGYYIYQSKKGEVTARQGASTSGEVSNNPPNQPLSCPRLTSLR